MKRLRLSLIFLVLSFTACYRPATTVANLDVDTFKQQFNAAPGVRLLLLLSPT